MIRYNPNNNYGLNTIEVNERIKNNLVNYDTSIPTKSVKQIISGNLFTLFNLLNLTLGLAVFLVGSYKNLLFLGVVISNVIISTFQEIQAKRIIDKLSLITSTKAKVIRNGNIKEININEIVLDDILVFKTGNQVVTDSILVEGQIEVNESFITGESNPIIKKVGDMILSGSFIISGNAKAKVEHIGNDNYTSAISKDAKYIKKTNSEILNSLKKVIKIISFIIVPMGLLLFYNQINIESNTLRDAVVNTVAALIGMIPEGLMLLTSTVFAVSIIRLSKYKVLIQDLYCTEALARVDTLCLDKTGTLTEGVMEVTDLVILSNRKKKEVENILCNLSCNLSDDNSTINAIRDKYNSIGNFKMIKEYPFSSKKKWSGVTFENIGSYIIGAPEFILKDRINEIEEDLKLFSKNNRVLLLGHIKTEINNNSLKNIEVIALILIRDKIRSEATKTLKYFKDAKVDVKIISGDNVLTVANIARRVGIDIKHNYIDATTLDTYEKIKDAVNKYSIFGRVSPFQKKQIIIALKELGHTVAMTGDGVNDCLALKEADCSIAMASGSEAARNVSQLILLDSNFDSLPAVVKEGRRSINNIERSATLFLVKTIYATIIAFIFAFINMNYPFEPIQLTLTSVLTIGIPSFVLALEPNKEKIKGKFLINVISKAIPTALTIVANIILIMIISNIFNIKSSDTSTLCVILTGMTGFILLYNLCIPFNFIRRLLFGTMITLFLIGILGLRKLFSLTLLTPYMFILVIILVVCSLGIFSVMNNLSNIVIKNFKHKITI